MGVDRCGFIAGIKIDFYAGNWHLLEGKMFGMKIYGYWI